MGQIIQMAGWRDRQKAKARQGGIGINKHMFKPFDYSVEDLITKHIMQSLLLTQLIPQLRTAEEREQAAIDSFQERQTALNIAGKNRIEIRWTGPSSFELIKITKPQ